MIIDIHSHVWPSPTCFTPKFVAESSRMRGRAPQLITTYAEYRASASACEVSVVFGGKARLAGIWIDDADVAAYVKQAPNELIGFLSIDPTQPGWEDELRHGHQQLGLKGVKLLPMYAGFFPDDTALDPFWKYAQQHGLPVLLHTGTTFVSQGPIECTLPRHVDNVARRFPDVKIIMAHLAHPFEGECVAVIRKHPNVYADLSALHYRPWQLFNSLMLVHEYGVWEKVLFGSDYPVTTVDESVAGLRAVCSIKVDRFQLPIEKMEELIHRDSLTLLGLALPR
jgi:uncharacterized protein